MSDDDNNNNDDCNDDTTTNDSSLLLSSNQDETLRVKNNNDLLQRGAQLRQWRQLALLDEQSRQSQALNNNNNDNEEEQDVNSCHDDHDDDDDDDGITHLSNGMKILDYNIFLQNQFYYDDLKHIDCHFIEYGFAASSSSAAALCGTEARSPCPSSTIIIEQDKRLGKGGWCWDAAFVLAEYFIAILEKQQQQQDSRITSTPTRQQKILELGAGTGLCGIFVARSQPQHVDMTISDLPNLMPLMQRNIQRNYHTCRSSDDDDDDDDDSGEESFIKEYRTNKYNGPNYLLPKEQNIQAIVLDWDEPALQQQQQQPDEPWDVILGSDIVASLYDPIALARAIYKLSDASTVIYISFKERLSEIHRTFEMEMQRIFGAIEIITPEIVDETNGNITWQCRNRNPDIRILIAKNKKQAVTFS